MGGAPAPPLNQKAMSTPQTELDFDRAEFWNAVLGQYDFTEWVIFSLFFIIGSAIFFYGDVTRSRRSDPNMPTKFNFWFMVKDNAFRFVVVLGSIYLAIRFHSEFLGIDTLNEKNCLFHGISIDAIMGKIAGSGIKEVPMVKKARMKTIQKLNNGHGTH